MKKRQLYLFLLISFYLIGCEIYEQPTYPIHNLNGRWDVVDIKVVIDKVNYDSEVRVVDVTKAVVSNFFVTGVNENNELMLSQDYDNTIINRRFDIASTQWEFDYYNLRIKDDISDESMFITFPCVYCTKYTEIDIVYNGYRTRYTFSGSTYVAMPSSELVLTSQSFYTNILIGGNQYDKAIISHLEITLHKI